MNCSGRTKPLCTTSLHIFNPHNSRRNLNCLGLRSHGAIRLCTTAKKLSLNLCEIQKPKCKSSKKDMTSFSNPHKPRLALVILVGCFCFTFISILSACTTKLEDDDKYGFNAFVMKRKCCGLPLALITIGRAMAGTKTPEEWEKKIQMLKNYPAKFPGMENRLFSRLAFSYDSLPDETIKSCFLYCSLFPEDYEISHRNIIQLWIGEGFLDECDNIQKARNQGEEVIKSLQLACLLENGISPLDEKDEYLKMHDVIRDMALWLAHENGKKKNKFVVKDGVESIRAQEVEKWKETQRISLWNTDIEEHRKPPYFPNIETFLASSVFIESFSNRFFTNMPIIRVLDLSNNFKLMKLPVEIRNLVTLQYLNLSCTSIEYLPVELKNLKKLRCLILNDMYFLESLPSQMVSSLSSLQLFSMYSTEGSAFKGYDERRLLEELEQLEHIDDISIDLTSVSSIQTLFNSHKLQRSTRWLQLVCERMNLVQLSLYIETLHIKNCFELQDVKINFENEVVVYSKFPRHPCLNNLCDMMKEVKF
ncbi:unnamed protein product, partial [Vitis vinifera]